MGVVLHPVANKNLNGSAPTFFERRLEMENQNRDFKGIWIPKDIYLSKELSWTDKLIFIEINSLDNEDHCVASNAYFSNFLGISERSVSRSISKLIQLGYVKVINFNGKQRALTTMSTQTRQECLGSIDTNVYHNNIINNIINNTPYNPPRDEVDFDSFKERWNRNASNHNNIPKVTLMTTERKKALLARLHDLKSNGYLDTIDSFFARVGEAYEDSEFLQGRRTEFLFTLDFVLQKKSFQKIIEKSYR